MSIINAIFVSAHFMQDFLHGLLVQEFSDGGGNYFWHCYRISSTRRVYGSISIESILSAEEAYLENTKVYDNKKSRRPTRAPLAIPK